MLIKELVNYMMKLKEVRAMNEILINVLSCIVTVVIIPLITLLGSKLIKWISSKLDKE